MRFGGGVIFLPGRIRCPGWARIYLFFGGGFFSHDKKCVKRECVWCIMGVVIKTKAGLGYMDVSKNRGTPKWMVYDGKPY